MKIIKLKFWHANNAWKQLYPIILNYIIRLFQQQKNKTHNVL